MRFKVGGIWRCMHNQAVRESNPVISRVVRLFERALDDGTMARHLEVCLWNWTIRTCIRDRIPLFWSNSRLRYRYTTRALSLAYNLRHPRNPALGDRVRSRELSLKSFANMSPREMFPGLYAEIEARKEAEKERARRWRAARDVPDGLLVCRGCGSRKTQYALLQTRSADEPMTAFVTCMSCGKRWKE